MKIPFSLLQVSILVAKLTSGSFTGGGILGSSGRSNMYGFPKISGNADSPCHITPVARIFSQFFITSSSTGSGLSSLISLEHHDLLQALGVFEA